MSCAETAAHHDILLLGGGAAGLALGHELKRRGLSFLILEQGSSVGDSWRRMPARLKLVSPWRANRLPGTPSNCWPLHHEMRRDEFHSYLRDYAATNSLPVRTDTRVITVTRAPGAVFSVETSEGRLTSDLLVNATGYFSKPFIPDIPGASETGLVQIHFADYVDPDHFQQRVGNLPGSVLVVGKRLSAGQLLVELVDAGFDVGLSHRSPIEFGPGPISHWLFFRIFPEIERIKLWLRGPRASGFDVKMDGGRARQLVRSGVVKMFPGIRRFDGSSVVFEDDSRIQPRAVVYATGFLPALDHLRPLLPELNVRSSMPVLEEMESVAVPGLFFLGLHHQRNLQSRFLRGIRSDAAVLAARLHTRLQTVAQAAKAPHPQLTTARKGAVVA